MFATAVWSQTKKNNLVTALAADIAGSKDGCKLFTNIIVYDATEKFGCENLVVAKPLQCNCKSARNASRKCAIANFQRFQSHCNAVANLQSNLLRQTILPVVYSINKYNYKHGYYNHL